MVNCGTLGNGSGGNVFIDVVVLQDNWGAGGGGWFIGGAGGGKAAGIGGSGGGGIIGSGATGGGGTRGGWEYGGGGITGAVNPKGNWKKNNNLWFIVSFLSGKKP